MGAEQPALAAVIARLAHPEIHLAAYGGLIYPLALIVEAPIIMLLAASTALSKDLASYFKLRRFMLISGALLTLLHVLLAFTPLFYVVTQGIIGAPAEILAPARLGLMIMVPWTWAIAYRRFNQGVLIRCGHARTVGAGTVVRLLADGVVLAAGYLLRGPGVAVASAAIIAGVLSEAAYTAVVVQPVLAHELALADRVVPALTWRGFGRFYIPLVLTALLSFLAPPITSAALSRMPQALSSLAAWPVVIGLVVVLRNLGTGYNEVVVALLEKPGGAAALRRFALGLAVLSSGALLVIAATPLAGFWFRRVSALTPELAGLAQRGLWLTILLPALSVLQSWYQGTMLHHRRTNAVGEAVAVYLVATGVLLGSGVIWGRSTGLLVGLVTLTISTLAQTAWLWYRGRPILRDQA